MKTMKRIAAFVFAISFCFVLMLSPGANAQGLLGGQQFGAIMAAGLYATSILLNSLNIGVPGHFNEVCQWVNTPTKVEQGTFFDYNWPEPNESISEYLNRSIIKVNQGVTTIDGVEYDELWISPEGAGKVKANVFDFKTKWAIMSNNAGTLASGTANIMDVPIYSFGSGLNNQHSQYYTINPPAGNSIGSGNVTYSSYYERYVPRVYFDDGTSSQAVGKGIVAPYRMYIVASNMSGSIINQAWLKFEREYSGSCYVNIPGKYINNEDFQYDYVSGIIPAEESDIPENYGLSMKIPHDLLQTFYETYPQYDQEQAVIDIEQDQIDIDELTQSIFDMIDSLEDIKAEWTDGEVPVPVDPIENIDQNVEDISQYQADMQQQVDHMHQDVEAIHQTQQAQHQTQQQIQQDTSSIDNTLKDATATPGQSDLPSFKFDLRELFPFCIPFDIYRLLSSFDATPQAPHVQLPIVIPSIGFNYTLDLDFSAWNPVAQAMRTAELIVYAIGLAWATGKVIKW